MAFLFIISVSVYCCGCLQCGSCKLKMMMVNYFHQTLVLGQQIQVWQFMFFSNAIAGLLVLGSHCGNIKCSWFSMLEGRLECVVHSRFSQPGMIF